MAVRRCRHKREDSGGVLCALALVLFLLVGGLILILLALGAGWRLFTKDFPEQPSLSTATYFADVLCAFAALVWIVTVQSLARP
jgi:hypothetical protein